MNKKAAAIFVFIGILLLTTLASTASAAPTHRKDSAVGTGVFIHDHEGLPHTHYFAFSVQEGPKCNPQGTFHLVCKHDGQIVTIIVSTRITSFDVDRVQGGLEAVFTGSAIVKMDNEPWTRGWTFTVTAIDSCYGPDMLGITLVDPQGQVHCNVEPTPLSSGNIKIKTC